VTHDAATAIGWVADTPIPRARLEARVRELRAGQLAARLPTVGSKEDRQFLRWTAQVLLTEEMCRVELARLVAATKESIASPPAATESALASPPAATESALASPPAPTESALASPPAPTESALAWPPAPTESALASPPAADNSSLAAPPDAPQPDAHSALDTPEFVASNSERALPNAVDAEFATSSTASGSGDAGSAIATAAKPRILTHAESLHLGSINAAAWSNSQAMSVLFDLVTAPTPPPAPTTAARAWYRVTHAVAASPQEAADVPEQPLGWTTLDDLPAHLAAELRAAPPGTRVGPIRSGLGWHFATVVATDVRPVEPAPKGSIDPARPAAFNRWLDQRRRALVTHAPGFEHPGDPSQPDNTHRH
jgi:[acyl-carrier-protein] S-malonyltransferase